MSAFPPALPSGERNLGSPLTSLDNTSPIDERPPLSPAQTAVVTLETDIGLHEHTGERAGNPHEGKHRLAQTE